ncbi:tyrosine-protein kinase SYK [Rhipicephalus sanguineus]|uniref:tyrosine-protein kinase SYK n=1 Tax=Rhipicephalus sanguineus TaxID=34632 RepID=UPI0020C33814|nr:tyrosine-protein kinase SYK [Rhipicephalus sanguineus]
MPEHVRAGSAGGGVTLSAEPSCCGAADEDGDGGDSAEPLEEAACFYGAVSRETAEWILWERGCADGLYLLRRSGPDYVLSLCFDRSVLHYRIRRLAGAGVELCGLPGQQFRDPWALLEGVQGLATRPSLPCNRARDAMLPPTHWGLSDDTVRAFMLLKARQWGMDEQQLDGSPTPPSPQGVRPEGSPGPGDLRSLLSKTLHEIQPWFHGRLSRADAERRLQDAGHLDGRFLVRERDDSSYALCLSHGGSVKHYKVDVTPSGEFAIQDGQRFPSIMSLISHYTLFSDGLWCPLTEACVRPDCHLAVKPASTVSRAEQRRSFAATTTTTTRTGILNRLVASITPQQAMERSRTMPRLRAPSRLSCSSPPPQHQHHLPAASTAATIGCHHSSSGAHTSSGGGRRSATGSRLHKASSFDHLLPGFISYLFSGDGDRKTLRRKSSGGKRLPEMEQTLPRRVPSVPSEYSCERPVPAPRHSLARRDYQEDPVYANRQALLRRAAAAAAASAAASAESGTEAAVPDETTQVDEKPAQEELAPLIELESPPPGPPTPVSSSSGPNPGGPCRRSASSPSVATRALMLSDLDSFPQPVPLPDEARSPSPTLILFSECGDLEDGPYEEIDSAGSLSDSATLPGSDSGGGGSPASGCLIDVSQEDDAPLPKDKDSSAPASPERYLPPGPGSDGGLKPWLSKEESESAYQAMKRFVSGPMSLDPKLIVLKDRIGVGNFGEVHRALFGSGPVEVQIAVKRLRDTIVGDHKEEIMNEAQTMAQLDHPHIVRLIGISQGQSLMLVMELAPLGPLNRFLRLNRSQLRQDGAGRVLALASQVCGAMAYLEARQLVHRDLAARNVLLVNDRFVKVSDFGMTRALGSGKDYYKAQAAGKWPLRWYAPECIYFFKFSTKSDVWSFGVTLWEAMSYGERPYQGLAGQSILAMLESGKRLEQPDDCPERVYQLMQSCWQYKPDDRPTFTEICATLREALEDCT